ncbi:MAG: DUF1315 family protein [Saccharospirillaceae bacterium]|nr:YeaC family protein [Pseudomonadales bacterium]NRB79070.1 DUF1315 family protein [Saccharospirillaceae bacterium]
MSFVDVAKNLDLPTYEKLKTAVEIGKWPTGQVLTQEQKSICMEAVMTYEMAHFSEEKRTGYMEQACKSTSTVDLITKQ